MNETNQGAEMTATKPDEIEALATELEAWSMNGSLLAHLDTRRDCARGADTLRSLLAERTRLEELAVEHADTMDELTRTRAELAAADRRVSKLYGACREAEERSVALTAERDELKEVVVNHEAGQRHQTATIEHVADERDDAVSVAETRANALVHVTAERDELKRECERLLEFERDDHTEKDLTMIASLTHESARLRAERDSLKAEVERGKRRAEVLAKLRGKQIDSSIDIIARVKSERDALAQRVAELETKLAVTIQHRFRGKDELVDEIASLRMELDSEKAKA